jgi:CHAD domain-containing protein
VQREALLKYEKKIPLSRRPGLTPLFDYFKNELEKRRTVLPVSLKTLLDRPFRTAILGFRRDADASRLEQAIAKTVARRTKRVTRRRQALEKKFTATTLHHYRIACKKLRYVLEVVVAQDGKKPSSAKTTGGSEEKALKVLVSLQELLGINQDIVVLMGYLKKVRITPEIERVKKAKKAEQDKLLKKIKKKLGIS